MQFKEQTAKRYYVQLYNTIYIIKIKTEGCTTIKNVTKIYYVLYVLYVLYLCTTVQLMYYYINVFCVKNIFKK